MKKLVIILIVGILNGTIINFGLTKSAKSNTPIFDPQRVEAPEDIDTYDDIRTYKTIKEEEVVMIEPETPTRKENDEVLVEEEPVEPTSQDYTEDDLELLARVIYHEGKDCSDRYQQLVAQVVLNRVKDPRFPDTIQEVVDAPRQYSWRGTKFEEKDPKISERIYTNARAALDGLVDCPENVVFQANFEQGTGIYQVIEYKSIWYSSVSYFCYG